MPADPAAGQGDRPAVLVLVGGDPDEHAALVRDLEVLLPSLTILQTGPGAGPVPGRTVLRAGHGRPRWQRAPLRVTGRLLPAGPRAALAARLDPRLLPAVRSADLVLVFGPGAKAVAARTRALAPTTRVAVGAAPVRTAAAQVALGWLPAGPPRRRASLPQDELDALCAAVRLLRGDGSPTPEVRERARLVPWTTLDDPQRQVLVEALVPLLGADDVVLRAWAVLGGSGTGARHAAASGGARGHLRRVGTDPREAVEAATDLLAAADGVLEAEPGTAARWAALALRLLPPGGALSARDLLQGSRTGRALTDPVRARPQTAVRAAAAGAAGADAAPEPSSHHRVLVLPKEGSGPPLRTALRVSPVVDLTLLGGGDGAVPSSLRGDGVPDALVEARLRAGLGTPGPAYPSFTAAVQDGRPDVVLVDGADQRAVLASLVAPVSARLLVLLRPEDLDAPWLPLLETGRVERLLVEDDASGDLVRGLAPGAVVEVVPGLGSLRSEGSPEDAATVLREAVLGDVGRLADRTRAGEHEDAMALVHELLDRPDGAVGPAVLQQAALTATKAGEPGARLAVLRRWAATDDRPLVATLVREQEGRLREFDPNWWPGDLAPRPVDPVPGRVLHVLKASLPQRTSGYAVRSFYLLRERRRSGEDVLAATALDFPDEPAPPVQDVGGVPHLRLTRTDVPDREAPDQHLDAFARRLLDVVTEHRPAVLHAHSGHRGYELALVALAVGRATGIPVVYEVRGLFEAVWTSDVGRATRSELYRLRRELETRVLTEADAVVTLSESMREDIVQRPPTRAGRRPDPARVVVVPNGVDAEAIGPRAPRADLRERLALGEGLVVGYVSNLDHPREGQETLVEAVSVLRGRGLAVSALLVGGGERQEALERLAAERGVAEHVVLTGQVPHEEVGDYYALLDVFVVPRIDERAARLVTPLKPYEAMSMGLPLVVSALPALLEVVGGGERGATFPPGDAEALADVLAELLHDPARRAEMARSARAWVREHRTWSAIATRYDEVYEIATRARPPSAGRVGQPVHGVDEGA
ncbi:glycosyltransferase family 4 protein [uncultured Serinicoccus sp.]|uniref:glycosyltransferase family 4 protein n=1 Tax=uncultured Serinicoccus sp. TaxID=735514 RepID=UPI002625E758|nr:glycosyltransferase family 4 protein [uncultured Serinicoccus sp.]